MDKYTAEFIGVSLFKGALHYAILDPMGDRICTLTVPDRTEKIEKDPQKVSDVAALLSHLNRGE